MNKSIIYSIIDGVIQGIILELLLYYITSTMWSYSIINIFGLIVFFALSVMSAFFLLIRTSNKSRNNYLLSSIFFIVITVLFFVNKITLKIRLFPISQRELNDAEGIVIIISVMLFLLLLIIERLGGLIWKHLRKN